MVLSYLFNTNDAGESKLLLPKNYRNYFAQSSYYHTNDDGLQEAEEERINRRETKKMRWLKHTMRFFLVFFIFVAFYVAVIWTKPLNFRFKEINTIISFGDSYTTRYLNMDNLNYACRDCTSAGGPNWVIYLTENTHWVSWDFAYNSAPVNNTIVHQSPTVIDVSTQIQDFYNKVFTNPTKTISTIVKSVYKNTKRTPKSTLTTIWVGINDIDLTFDWKDTNALDLRILNHYEILLDKLVEKGETQFMLFNVPPLNRTPLWKNSKYENVIKDRVIGYNEKLKNMIKEVKKRHPYIIIIHYDVWGFFNLLLDNPSEYNIKDINTFCSDWHNPTEKHCKPIEDYFWLNDLHPTYPIHRLLANDVEKYLSSEI